MIIIDIACICTVDPWQAGNALTTRLQIRSLCRTGKKLGEYPRLTSI